MFQPTTFIYLPHFISFTVMVDHIKPRNLRQEEKNQGFNCVVFRYNF